MPDLESPRAPNRRPKDLQQGHGSAASYLSRSWKRAHARPMRSPESKDIRERPSRALSPPPPAGVMAFNRMAFGPRPGDLAAFEALGPNDAARMQAFVDQQLDPDSIADTEYETRLAASGYTTLHKSMVQLWTDHVVPNPPWEDRMRPIMEMERAVFLRATYSRKQLVEVLADFWHNHFNVYGWDFWIGPAFVSYDRDVIRANMLGRFRDMLEAVASSQAMLYYLDNYLSTDEGPNENYARELCELHAMGAENYMGTIPAANVPRDAQNRPVAFVDEDVFDITRCFTGWTFDFADGQFFIDANDHDDGEKTVLGTVIPAGGDALTDGRAVLDLLAEHPGTARYIARKLCQRFFTDDPPTSVVNAAANTYLTQYNAPDQLSQVVRTILLSNEFLTSWGDKVRRPFEMICQTMRTCNADFNVRMDDASSNSFMWRFGQTGQNPFSWRPPNGYPDEKEDWLSTTPLIMTWRMINWLVDLDENDVYLLDVVGDTPLDRLSATELADFWIDRLLGRPMLAAERQEIIQFMAQGRNPAVSLNWHDDVDVQSRIRSMCGLILLSPENLWR